MEYPVVVNLSLPKTGSTTIYTYFEDSGACHEGLHEQTVDLIIGYRQGEIELDGLEAMIVRRQKYLKTKIDSSTFLHLISREIVDVYPEGTSYLTILRNPVQWVKSYLGMLYQFGKALQEGSTPFGRAWAARYGTFQAEELDPVALVQNIDDSCYLERVSQNLLQFWIDSELKIFNSVPSNRLYVFQIEALGDALELISKIIGTDLILDQPAQKFNESTADGFAKALISQSLERSMRAPLVAESLNLYENLCGHRLHGLPSADGLVN